MPSCADLWNRAQIDEGLRQVELAFAAPRVGPYALQAAIAAEHARAAHPDATDWEAIVALYQRLWSLQPTPVVALNRAAAVSMASGAEEALRLVDRLAPDLDGYGPFHAARADFLRTLRRWPEAERSYERAIELATNDPERRFLEERLREARRAFASP